MSVGFPAVGVGKSDINRLLRSKKNPSFHVHSLINTGVRSFGGIHFLGKINAFWVEFWPLLSRVLSPHAAQITCLHEAATSIQNDLRTLRPPLQRTCRRSVPPCMPAGTPRDISGDRGHLKPRSVSELLQPVPGSPSGPFWCKVTPLSQLFACTGETQEPVGNTTLPCPSLRALFSDDVTT